VRGFVRGFVSFFPVLGSPLLTLRRRRGSIGMVGARPAAAALGSNLIRSRANDVPPAATGERPSKDGDELLDCDQHRAPVRSPGTLAFVHNGTEWGRLTG
jgi:hypothetical protein